ncbi:hypothetical protein [Streptomyces werraensis]|uniref:hypothetical protein n=1 Tax=Streptomyces werraensis TaxID=68284 RepID=UPI0037FFF9B0
MERQLAGERDFALWSARREAFAAYLSTIEHLRVTFNHAVGLAEAHYVEGRNTAARGQEAKEALDQQHKDLLLAQATLHLTVASSEVDEVEALTEMATGLISGYDDFVEHLGGGGHCDENALFARERALKEQVAAWAQRAGHQLQGEAVRSVRPPAS